jgi:hypothetical protein
MVSGVFPRVANAMQSKPFVFSMGGGFLAVVEDSAASGVLSCAGKRARQLTEAVSAIENGSLGFLSPLQRSQIWFGHAAQAARQLRTGALGGKALPGRGKLRLAVSIWEVGYEQDRGFR